VKSRFVLDALMSSSLPLEACPVKLSRASNFAIYALGMWKAIQPSGKSGFDGQKRRLVDEEKC